MFSYRVLFQLFVLLASGVTLAQGPASTQGRAEGFRMPTDEEIAKSREKVREAMGRLPDLESIRRQYGAAGVPNVEAMPKPAAPAIDVASIAEKYKQIGQAAVPQNSQPDLLVLVSLSMPKEALVRAADQAERAGGTLIFRGLKGDSMMKMGEEIKKVIGNRNVPVAVHPPAFQQFSVSRVPAVVIARPEAANVLDNGCAKQETFVKVTGDVSLDYALEYIERKSPAWADVARYYRSKIVRGIN